MTITLVAVLLVTLVILVLLTLFTILVVGLTTGLVALIRWLVPRRGSHRAKRGLRRAPPGR